MSVLWDCTFRVWNRGTGTFVKKLLGEGTGWVSSLAISNGDIHIVCGSRNPLTMWNGTLVCPGEPATTQHGKNKSQKQLNTSFSKRGDGFMMVYYSNL